MQTPALSYVHTLKSFVSPLSISLASWPCGEWGQQNRRGGWHKTDRWDHLFKNRGNTLLHPGCSIVTLVCVCVLVLDIGSELGAQIQNRFRGLLDPALGSVKTLDEGTAFLHAVSCFPCEHVNACVHVWSKISDLAGGASAKSHCIHTDI